MTDLRLGINLWSQAATWPEMLAFVRRVDAVGTTPSGRGITCTPSSATRTSRSSKA